MFESVKTRKLQKAAAVTLPILALAGCAQEKMPTHKSGADRSGNTASKVVAVKATDKDTNQQLEGEIGKDSASFDYMVAGKLVTNVYLHCNGNSMSVRQSAPEDVNLTLSSAAANDCRNGAFTAQAVSDFQHPTFTNQP